MLNRQSSSQRRSLFHYAISRLKEFEMDFPLFEDVILLIDLPEEGLTAGDIGVVVERHDVTGMETGYSVEFFDMLGNTVAVVTLPARALRLPMTGDRPVVRQVTEATTP
jgi:hypothetical protein